MAGRVLFEADHLAAVRAHGDDVFVERSAHDRPATIFQLAPGAPPRPVAQLAAGRPRGVLQAVEDDALICLEADGTLASIALRDGRRRALRRLVPAPSAVAITPTQVVWCSADTRRMDGIGIPRITGEVWRWWRGGERIERLGEHASARPDLVAAPPGAARAEAEVYVGADEQLGVVDAGGLRWLADEPQGVRRLACSADAVFYATQDRVKRLDRARGETRVVWRATIPLALAVAPHGRTLLVARNAVIDRRVEVEPSAVIAVDLDTAAGAVLGQRVGRPVALAASVHGALAIEEPWLGEARPSRLVLYPWGEPPALVLPGPPLLDEAAWAYPPMIQWWRQGGSGGYFQLDAAGAWTCTTRDGAASGALDPAARPALLAEAERWREDAAPLATGWVDLSQQRGWLVAWGTLAWHRAIGDHASPAARGIDRLLALLAPACPPLAAVVREGF